MNRPVRALLCASLVLAACTESTDPTAPALPGESTAQARITDFSFGGDGPQSFILIAAGTRLPSGLVDRVAAAGGTVTGSVPEIGVAFATSTDPSFGTGLRGFMIIPDVGMLVADDPHAAFDGQAPQGIGDDEPLFPYQWGMRAIHAPQAWADGSLGQGVTVAVLDEGFDLTHPDLSYAPGAVSFVCYQGPDEDHLYLSEPPHCESPQYAAGFDYGGGVFPAAPADPFSHATHVSGIVAALDNGIGVIGVAPGVHILPVKVLSEYLGFGASSWIIQGIVHAANVGADVINMSLGGVLDLSQYPPGVRDDVMLGVVVIYRRAVNYAYQMGSTVVVAAGNDAMDADGNAYVWLLPAQFENAITVTATGPVGIGYDPNVDVDRPASYTNYGTSLADFAAPGGDYVLYPNGLWFQDMILSTGSAHSYYWGSGTSAAAPHVSGVAALIIAEHGGAITPAQVAAEMAHRADDLGKPGRDDYYGLGRISTGH